MAKLNFQKLAMAAAIRGGGAMAGGAAGVGINMVLPSTMNPYLKSGLKAVVGAIIPELVAGGKNEFVTAAGSGLCGQAGAELAVTLIPSLAPKVSGSEIGASYIVDEEDYSDTIYGTEAYDVIHGADDDDDDDDEYLESEDPISY